MARMMCSGDVDSTASAASWAARAMFFADRRYPCASRSSPAGAAAGGSLCLDSDVPAAM